jgi:hypothetical protein
MSSKLYLIILSSTQDNCRVCIDILTVQHAA